MNDDFTTGFESASKIMLIQCMQNLGKNDNDLKMLCRLLAERSDIIANLRRVCENHGDNDWTREHNLGQVIEKHLERDLDEGTDKHQTEINKLRNDKQKLVDICFSFALAVQNTQQFFSVKSNEDVAGWVAQQLGDCGFPVKPMGSSWGVLCGD